MSGILKKPKAPAKQNPEKVASEEAVNQNKKAREQRRRLANAMTREDTLLGSGSGGGRNLLG